MADHFPDVTKKVDFISRETAITHIKENQCKGCSDIGLCGNYAVLIALKLLKNVPAANVRPVVRAFWVGKMEGVGICSNCKRLDHIDPLATHCRYCGADMREPNLDATKGLDD